MWYHVENGDSVRPTEIDRTGSTSYVYVRRNITLIAASGDGDEDRPAHYEWDETKVPVDDWETFSKVMEHDDALDDVYAALIELAEGQEQ